MLAAGARNRGDGVSGGAIAVAAISLAWLPGKPQPKERTGRAIDAQVSPELIESIFMTGSPLHDGAVIIKGDRVLAAACLLPLSSNPTVSLTLGTRHRAGIGLTEDNDAVVVIVSEEDGTISVAHDGELERGFDSAQLLETLQDFPS